MAAAEAGLTSQSRGGASNYEESSPSVLGNGTNIRGMYGGRDFARRDYNVGSYDLTLNVHHPVKENRNTQAIVRNFIFG